jgi:hypothetical protein
VTTFPHARPLTSQPGNHFFGYYGIPPWNASQTLYACLESRFHECPPEAGERATIGTIDLTTKPTETGDAREASAHDTHPHSHPTPPFRPLTTTAAWNLQQGAMLHWLPTDPDRTLIFNDLDSEAGRFHPVLLDVTTGTRRTIDSPVGIGAVSPDGSQALGLDYARLHTQRPVVGYAGARDRTTGSLAPDDDGVWRIDLPTGHTTLALSHAAAAGCAPPPPFGRTRPVFFNHTLYNTDGTRFLVFLRYFDASGALDSAVFTATPDGRDLRCIVPWGERVSHFDWLDPHTVMVTVRHPSDSGRQYALVTDTPSDGWPARRILGEGTLVDEGHPSFSPDRRRFVFDSGPDADRLQTLRLYDLADNRITILGRFHAAPHIRGDHRCDLHPRWNRTGTQVSFDSVHTGDRQVYLVDVPPA